MLNENNSEATGIVRNGVRYVRDDRQTAKRAVINAAAIIAAIDPKELVGPCRRRYLIRGRQLAMYGLVRVRGLTLWDAGRYLRRDHTTVLHGVRKIEAEIAAGNEETIEAVAKLQETVARLMGGERIAPPVVISEPERAAPVPQEIAIAAPEETVDGEIEEEATLDRVEVNGRPTGKRPIVREIVADPYAYEPFSAAWWAANDLSFRRGLQRAYQTEGAS